MILKIEGDDNKINRLEKELRLRIKRDGLKMSVVEKKKQKESKPPVEKEPKPKAKKPEVKK